MTNRLFFSLTALALATALSLSVSCKKEKSSWDESFNVSGVILPEVIETTLGANLEFGFVGGHGPVMGDEIVFEGTETFRCAIVSVSDDRFSFVLGDNVASGDYHVTIERGGVSRGIGRTQLIVTTGIDIDPAELEEGTTVYSQVSAKGVGLEGVVVSDGEQVAVTDADGIYGLVSEKKSGYVFISVPSGYEPISNGVLPRIHKQLTSAANVAERADFALVETSGQENARILLLGDMTWDLYWKTNNYSFREYLQEMGAIRNLLIYQTIGNHDHSMYYPGDDKTVKDYTREVSPNYYSFNVGGVHCVVLDNVECTNSVRTTDGKGNPCYERAYTANIVSKEIQWLQSDLAQVPTTTPLVVTMHIPMYNPDGSFRMGSAISSQFESILSQYQTVHLFTGHITV